MLSPYAFVLGNGLRATGDVRYTMIVAVASSVGGRCVMAYLFGVIFGWGVIGVAIAMCVDWTIRATLYKRRLDSGAWKNFQVI